MTYYEAIDYIDELDKKALIPDHQNSVGLMSYLGNPQDTMPVIHVGGTNGKGSTIAYLKAIYMAEGYKVGSFTSPHIISPRELTGIGNEMISEDAFATTMTRVKETCDRMVADGLPHPTSFECLTAASLLYLSTLTLDVVLIEVGLGGRYDATNVFKKPLLTVLTAIDFDHTAILGKTLKEIAWHKGGIIKKGVTTVIAPNPIEVIETISNCVREADGTIYLMDEGFISEQILMTTNYTKLFHLRSNFFDYKGLQTSMMGIHQTNNLATALLAVHQLKKVLPVEEISIKKGVKNTCWTCRNDLISKKPLIMVDGGHNPSAFDAMDQLLKGTFSDKRIITVLGLLADKDHGPMIEKARSFSHQLILTEPISERALNLEAVTVSDAYKLRDYREALKKALSLVDDKTLILVLGSLYLAYPAKEWLMTHLASAP